ncbi:hypothetical protein OHB41_50385 [Streptomyces sp. NBC_01571]|uniref:hypothetical protein n=1 Tax=Streptomyces sp. NBC_01571 TaxID=2975883 RepID=UPI00225AEB00|nr:hypothetical protein [Streptomyces sp. NBC_01571]MCX4581171.1 hypothetical protein [Streptomyces sp. NBC_01571]
MEYRYVRVQVFGASHADLRTETALSEEHVRGAYEEQPVYINQDPTSITVRFDDAGPVITYLAQRPADWDERA